MGFLDTLLGRTKPVPPKLDDLFAVPTAAITLQAAMGLVPTGTGSVCFRAAEGRAFSDIERDVRELLSMGSEAGQAEVTNDSYGFTWLVCRHSADDVGALVTDLHAVNSSLVDGGFGPQLLCTLVGFRNESRRRLGIVFTTTLAAGTVRSNAACDHATAGAASAATTSADMTSARLISRRE